MNIEDRFGRKEANQMKSKYSFISTASGVLLSLTTIVAEAASAETLLVSTHAPLQESKASPINAAVVPAVATVASSPLQAKVIDCVGKVKWRTDADIAWKDAKEAAVNDLLSAGAEVRTGLRSRMTLKFENATILIDSNSNFAMPTAELVKESDGDVYRTVAQMKSGRADFQVDKVGAKNDFKVVTPSSTLAVRGTGFSVATGAMTGTEVTGARTNAIAAIQLKYAATNQVVQMSGGGDSKSSSASPEPATSSLMSSIGALPMAGTATSAAEHEASASMGTTQTTAQTQVGSTIATVAAAVTEASGGSTEPETGDSAAAVFADVKAVDGFLHESTFATQSAGVQLQLAIDALSNAQAALSNAQFHSQAARDARDDVEEAAVSVAVQLALVNDALAESGEARSAALENARQALALFAVSGEGDVRGLANDAINDASRSRVTADDALSGSALVVDFSQTALGRLSEAFDSQSNAQSAANQADSAALEGSSAAASARDFLALVKIARDEIASIYARRPLSGIADSLSAAFFRLELSSQAVLLAENARDDALTAALSAQADAQDTVLAAAQAAALAAAQDALAALNAANAADVAATDTQTGMGKLDLAIDAMLNARDENIAAQSNADSAIASLQSAVDQTELAQSKIADHATALSLATSAQLDAAGSLVTALLHMNEAIRNSEFTTNELEACLARLQAQDIAGAQSSATGADSFSQIADSEALLAQSSANDALGFANAAQDQVGTSESVGEFINDATATGWNSQVNAALNSAVNSQTDSQTAASASASAATVAQTQGNAFALQFESTEAASAALAAVAQALTFASQAGQSAQSAVLAVQSIRDALAAAQTAGGAADFGATEVVSQVAQNNANDAQMAADTARTVADIALAEAATAQSTVDTYGYSSAVTVASNAADSTSSQISVRVSDVANAIASHESASAGASGAMEIAQAQNGTAETRYVDAANAHMAALAALNDMLAAIGSGNSAGVSAESLASQVESVLAAATQANTAAGLTQAQLEFVSQSGFVETSLAQESAANTALLAAQGFLPALQTQSAIATDQSLLAADTAVDAQESAGIAGSTIAGQLSNHALALSVAAVTRAQATLAAQVAAETSVDSASSGVESTDFGATQASVTAIASAVSSAGETASAAAELSASASDHLLVGKNVVASYFGSLDAVDSMQLAIDSLSNAQAALSNAQFHAQGARDARDDVEEAAVSVADQIALVNDALAESGEARSAALENARQALALFAVSGEGDVRGLANDAINDASRSRVTADDALSGSALVVDFSETALGRLSDAFVSQSNAQSAANQADSAALEGSTAAASAREFLALVEIARDEIASIYARRPLAGIADSLSAALLRLELSSQAVLLAENARDDALTAALSAQADAQDTVLAAAQAAALAAAQDALAAFTAASAVDAAATDAQTGMGKLDLAIDAMLAAQDDASAASATQDAAQAFRDIAQARGVEAQAQIGIHSDAANVANNAQLDAAQALMEALGHLDSAIENSGFTTDSVAACLAALNEQNQDAATLAAIEARGFADATQVNADDAGVSAVDANEASGVAGSQTSLSADALSSYTDRLAEIRAALADAVANAAESARAAVGSSAAAGTAQTYGNAFALQFTGSDASQAALDAVERALTLAADANGSAQNAANARDDAAAALAAVTNESGDPLDFSATSAFADLAAAQAGEADDAAIEAARLAAVADAEAATAETAVGALDGLVGAQVALATSQNVFLDLSIIADDANGMLDTVQNFSDDAAARVVITESDAVAAEDAVSNISGLLGEFHENFGALLVALDNQDLDGANAITNGWAALGGQATNVLVSATDASSSATSTATYSGWQYAIDATQSLQGGIENDASAANDASQQVATAAEVGASSANDAAAMADLSHQFASAAIGGGSTQPLMVGAVANAASNLATLAGTAAQGASDLSLSANDLSDALAARISDTNFEAVSSAQQVALANAQRALAALESVQGTYDLGSAESNAASEAIQTLVNKIEADSAATNVEFQGVSVAGYADQIDSAISFHEEAFQSLQGATDGASQNLDSAIAARDESQLQDTNVSDSFEQMLLAMSSGDANLAMSFSQTAGEQAVSANDAADAAVSARNAASDQDEAAAGLAATSHEQELLAQDALDAAKALSPNINANSALAQQRAVDSQVSAGFSQDAATLAGSELAHAIADRALALSVMALERASAAIAARDTALDQVAMGSSAIQQASFQQSASLAGQAHQFALNASIAANDAQSFAINANNYGNLAQSSAGAFLASADAFAFRVDADVALGNTIFARDSASQAIGVHNEALTTVSSLFASAGVSLTEAESQMNFAVGFSNDAHTFFLATTYNGFESAFSADASATQSEFSAGASDSSAIETRGYANMALEQAAISQQAGNDYSVAFAQANAFAAVAGTATTDATNSAAQALAFSQAATNFAFVIGSAQANSARDFALAARDQAIVQRAGAVASRDAALAAADEARSGGDRVFFTRTAEIAADTVSRADQARMFADQAIQAATNARTDAASALVVANGGSGQTIPPPN